MKSHFLEGGGGGLPPCFPPSQFTRALLANRSRGEPEYRLVRLHVIAKKETGYVHSRYTSRRARQAASNELCGTHRIPKFQLTDVDECGESKHKCSADATCENTHGSFECKCNEGFLGDGVSCAGKLTSGDYTHVLLFRSPDDEHYCAGPQDLSISNKFDNNANSLTHRCGRVQRKQTQLLSGCHLWEHPRLVQVQV